MRVVGTIAQLWRFPVKSMQGEQVATAVLGPDGLEGDRRWAVRDGGDGRVLTAKRYGALLEASARSEGDTVIITLPDGTGFEAGDPDLDAALSDWLGRAARLSPAGDGGSRTFEMSLDAEHPDHDLFEWACPDGTFLDMAAAHVLTTASIAAAKALHPDGDWDVRRFRPTVLVDLVEPIGGSRSAAHEPAFPEDEWVGGELAIGDATLGVFMPTVRCPMPSRAQPGLPRDTGVAATLRDHHESNLGVYCTVTAAGAVTRGDAVRVG